MLPDLTPHDWWWTVAADGRVEVCVRAIVVEILEDGHAAIVNPASS
jgi:hypothetical protein